MRVGFVPGQRAGRMADTSSYDAAIIGAGSVAKLLAELHGIGTGVLKRAL